MYFESLSYMFLDKKTLLKIWLNPATKSDQSRLDLTAITCNLITRLLTIFHVELTQSTARPFPIALVKS